MNFSAPHGAGRLFGRSQATKTLSMEDFKKSMEGIYTSCISEKTLDESPNAYKDPKVIYDNINETCEVLFTMKPAYNFKATEEEDKMDKWKKKK
jgi:RNA-splicing ligase RtcB